jgi:hypothetical protein
MVSTLVVLGVIGLSVVITLVFTRWARGHVRMREGEPRWWSNVPAELPGVELRVFGVPTEAERKNVAARKRLDACGWADRNRGLVHIPIDVAIDLYLKEQEHAP